jgi:hypothetical protein
MQIDEVKDTIRLVRERLGVPPSAPLCECNFTDGPSDLISSLNTIRPRAAQWKALDPDRILRIFRKQCEVEEPTEDVLEGYKDLLVVNALLLQINAQPTLFGTLSKVEAETAQRADLEVYNLQNSSKPSSTALRDAEDKLKSLQASQRNKRAELLNVLFTHAVQPLVQLVRQMGQESKAAKEAAEETRRRAEAKRALQEAEAARAKKVTDRDRRLGEILSSYDGQPPDEDEHAAVK